MNAARTYDVWILYDLYIDASGRGMEYKKHFGEAPEDGKICQNSNYCRSGVYNLERISDGKCSLFEKGSGAAANTFTDDKGCRKNGIARGIYSRRNDSCICGENRHAGDAGVRGI